MLFLYFAIATILIVAMVDCIWASADPGDSVANFGARVRWSLTSANGLWVTLAIATSVSMVIAIANPGPSLLENVQETVSDQITDTETDWLNAYRPPQFRDKVVPQKISSNQDEKTWFWWKLSGVLLTLLVVSFLPVFLDDMYQISANIIANTEQSLGGSASTVTNNTGFLTWAWEGLFGKRPESANVANAPNRGATNNTEADSTARTMFKSALWAGMLSEIPSLLHALTRR